MQYFPKISTAFVSTFFQEQKMKHLEYKDLSTQIKWNMSNVAL